MWGTNKKKNSNRIFKFCLGNVYYWNGMNRIRICLIRNTFVSWVSWIQMRVQGAKYQPTPAKKWFIKFQPVLRIHSINADPGSAQEKKIKFQIRIWIQILFLVVFMLKLDEQFREKEIFNHLFFLQQFRYFFYAFLVDVLPLGSCIFLRIQQIRIWPGSGSIFLQGGSRIRIRVKKDINSKH